MKILHVAGARPNFPKVAPIMAALARQSCTQWLVHTGQHYDHNMSRVFFEELAIPEPAEFLNVGSGSHAEQTAKVMMAFEPVVQRYKPDWVVVAGDVNSTVAAALVASKLGVRVAHVEAGLRSRDRTMPEELNRLVTDQLSDLLLTPSDDASTNLVREGVDASKIRLVGNVMIDTLVQMLPAALKRHAAQNVGLVPGQYLLVTLHRPSNVDEPATLQEIITALETLARTKDVLFPVHPRTRKRIADIGLKISERIRLVDPLGYLDFMSAMHDAVLVITDSGGIQEETSYLGIPCLTARPNTERPVTITLGTNRLVRSTRSAIVQAAEECLSQPRRSPPKIPFWDGHAAERIAQELLQA